MTIPLARRCWRGIPTGTTKSVGTGASPRHFRWIPRATWCWSYRRWERSATPVPERAAARVILEWMNYRELGRTGWKVSDISFGAWAIGGSWGTVDDTESLAALHAAVDCGVNFIDTADVYGMGRSERLIAQLKRERKSEIIVATKAGRRLSPHTADGYHERNLTGFIEDSLRNLATDCLDLVQLHCPPTDVYYRPELFQALDRLVAAGKIRY